MLQRQLMAAILPRGSQIKPRSLGLVVVKRILCLR
uniref:Uncharacterized protein n=1 Tax=Medicago truncatula TaxID=3880 RepID=I3T578_MEDTR|nr:unknown [Medicago truncatula]